MNSSFIKKLPFSYHWILDKIVKPDTQTVLDVGCGTGSLMQHMAQGKKWHITGIDIYPDSIAKAKQTGTYEQLYTGDITHLPAEITNQKYDLVFCSQVVEHLSKEDALALIKTCEQYAKKQCIISTIVGFNNFSPLESQEEKENPYQEHKSAWDPKEFHQIGYQTRGQGIFFIYKEGYLAYHVPKIVLPILYAIGYLLSPLPYFITRLGNQQIAYKEIKE